MPDRPDYTTARANAKFGWSVAGTQGALRELTATPIREFNLDPGACIEAYRRGRPLLRERFGDDVGLPGVSTPAVSYGHPNTLGAELLFPEGGEVGVKPLYGSLAEGIEALNQPVDFLAQGMAPFFMGFREKLRTAFPGEAVGLSFGAEGPITTAYELRGQSFYMDVLDDLPLAVRFLEAAVDSVRRYHEALCALDGRPAVNPNSGGMCDDCASFIPPRLWSAVVLPAWERYYQGMTTGRRSAHVESLNAEHLPFLEDIGLCHFDPSISPRLTPPIIATHCRVPFLWRLGSFHYSEMSVQEVEDFVYQSAADGASSVVTYVAEGMCNDDGVAKVHAFIRAGKEAKRLVAEGCSREEIGQIVSAEGKQKLWEGWCGYLSPESTRGGKRRS
jgi:hypothetical protein